MQETGSANTSGQGSTAIVPDEIKGWNWAAFLMGPIWSIGHSVWIGLLGFVPWVGFIMLIVLGMKGGEWGWQNRKFESVEQFKQVQKIWVKWGIGLWILSVILWILYLAVFAAMFVGAAAHQSNIQQY